jgi:hypothetical protein
VKMELSAEELAGWRDHPVTRKALEWLQDMITTYRRDIPSLVVRNRLDDARAASGALQGYEEILAAFLEEPVVVTPEVEAPFVDPAARPSQRTP